MATHPAHERLEGHVERITFHNPENGFCVLRVQVGGQTDLQTVVGFSAVMEVGSHIECQGTWIHDKQYGLQFKAQQITAHLPQSLEGISRYLGSGLIKGIGPAYARAIVKVFGHRVWEVLESHPDALKQVPKLGEKRIAQIQAAWQAHKHIRALMVFLHAHGIGAQRVVRIYKTLGPQAVEKIQQNPYCLAMEVRGIGFKTADDLAQKLGLSPDAIERVQAGCLHVMQEYSSRGHSVVPQDMLLSEGQKWLALESDRIATGIQALAAAQHLIGVPAPGNIPTPPASTPSASQAYMLPAAYHAERGIARELVRLSQGTLPWTGIDTALQAYLDSQRFPLSPDQKSAISGALHHKVMILTGGPGVGKTTIVRHIIRLIKSWGCDVTLTAPTGRAAKRLSETTGFVAKTVHRLLRYDPIERRFAYHHDAPLPTDFVVIDESSMLDIYLMGALLKAIPHRAGVLIVGDVDQLPSVGPGLVLHDLIQSGCVHTMRLTRIFRQAQTSHIIRNAHRVNEGLLPYGTDAWDKTDQPSDFYWIPKDRPEATFETVLQLVSQDIPQRWGYRPIEDIQILTPSRRSLLGSVSFNSALQPLLNRAHADEPHVERFGATYRAGDKVIQLVNNYDKEVFNGDVGFIRSVELDTNTVWIDFEGRELEYDFTELDEIQLAYAVTIHKSQGSEYPVVVIPMGIQHFMLLERNLLYTGITRGKKLVVVVGEPKAVAVACRTLKAKKRGTHLPHCLAAVPPCNPIPVGEPG